MTDEDTLSEENFNALKISDAYAFAMACHAGDLYAEGHPYIWHVLDVARRLRPVGARYEIVGVLHDTVEHELATLKEVEKYFGTEIRKGVAAMSKFKGDRYFKDYMPRVMANDIARVVKYADATDNLGRTILIEDPERREKKRAKFSRVRRELEPLLSEEVVTTISSFRLPVF